MLTNLDNANLSEKTGRWKNHKNANPNANPNANLSVEKGAKSLYLAENKSHSGDVENHIVNDDGLPIRVGVMPAVVTIDTTGEENAVFVPVRARAGYLAGYGDTEFIGTLPAVKLLGARNRTYRIFEVDGNSMFNTLNDKDKVNAYWVRLSEVRDERIYVIVTRSEGIIIKRVINRYNTEGVLICKSDNNHKGEYPPIVLPVSDIVEIWYVEEATTRNLAPPGAIYDRVSQLEATVAIVMEKMKAVSSS